MAYMLPCILALLDDCLLLTSISGLRNNLGQQLREVGKIVAEEAGPED